LLKGSSHPVLQSTGVQAFEQRKSSIIELLVVSQGNADAPSKAAMKLLALHERSETCPTAPFQVRLQRLAAALVAKARRFLRGAML
jgi:hypothetical protein